MKFLLEDLGRITENLNKKRIPLNSKQRALKKNIGIYPYYGANNILDYIDEYVFDEKILCIAEDGGRWGANEKCSYIVNEKCWVNNHAHVLSSNGKSSLEYLSFYLNYANLNKHITGSTRGKLTRRELEKIKIPLPSLEDQQRIAKVLSTCEEAIAKRKEGITLLDELLKATFLEMFEIEIKKVEKWEPLGNIINELTDYHSNGSYKILNSNITIKNNKDFALMIRTKDLEKNDFENDCIYINEKEYNFLSKSKVFGDEIIITKIGSAGNVYLMPFLNRPVSLGMNAFLLRLKKDINSRFIYYYLKSEYGNRLIKKRVKGAVTKTITKDAVRSITIPKVLIEKQNQFAEIVKKVEAIKSTYETHLQELENLYGSLSQKAFKGELDVSKVEISESILEVEDSIKKVSEPTPQGGDFALNKKDTIDYVQEEAGKKVYNKISKKELLKHVSTPPKKQDITNLSLADYYGIPEEIQARTEKIEFDFVGDDLFYQFLLKDTFTKKELFTSEDIEKKLQNYFYSNDVDFQHEKWKQIIFKFLEADTPLLSQHLDPETKTIKLQLTNAAFTA